MNQEKIKRLQEWADTHQNPLYPHTFERFKRAIQEIEELSLYTPQNKKDLIDFFENCLARDLSDSAI